MEKQLFKGNEDDIQKLLQLLSDLPKDRLNVNNMQYIGGIDSLGNICRDIEKCPEEMKAKIQIEQEKYKEKIKEEKLIEV